MSKQQLNFINYPLIFLCCDLTPLLATKSATEAKEFFFIAVKQHMHETLNSFLTFNV